MFSSGNMKRFVSGVFQSLMLPRAMAEQDSPPEPTEGRASASHKQRCTQAQVEMFALYLKCTTECMEEVQKLPSPKFYNRQREYLVEKLRRFVNRIAGVVLVRLQGSSVDAERRIEVLKLALVLAKKIESFVKSCSNDSYVQVAIALTNTSKYVASIGFDLELCSMALCKDDGCTARLTMNQVQAKYEDEVKEVENKVSEDVKTLVTTVLHELCEESLKNENRLMAIYLLQRLNRMDPTASSILSGSPLYSVIDDQGILGAMYNWVRQGKAIGRGASATVFKAKWLGTQVAKKTFMGRENSEFMKEAETLSKLNHPNITSMFCCEKDRWSSSLIMEIMDGDLHGLMLERCRRARCDNPPFTIYEAVDIILQVGEGVNYLHEKSICHRDLKSLNILVKSMLTSHSEVEVGYVHAKVADFGLAKTKNSTTLSYQTLNTGTHRWMAPEIIESLSKGNTSSQPKYPFKIDVHGFAMLCYEVLTGFVPFYHEANPRIIKENIKSGIRPELPNNCPPELKVLIQECWDKSPRKRPSFPDICLRLKYVKYLLLMGFCSSEDTQAPTKSQVAEDTQAPTKPQVVEVTQAPTKIQVAEDTQASTKPQVAEYTQASTKPQVAEDTQAPTKSQVTEDTQAPTKIQVAEDTQASPLVESEAIPGFSSLNGDMRSTFLNLIQVSNLINIEWIYMHYALEVAIVELEEVCRLLAIVQDREPSDIRRFIFQLSALKLVNQDSRSDGKFENGTSSLDLSNLRVHKKSLEKVLCKNPDLDIWLEVKNNLKSASFPNALVSLSLQRIRVLGFYDCEVVECVDLSNFPALRLLSIQKCLKLKEVKGWEVVKELGWLDIFESGYSMDFPRVQCLPSLRKFRYDGKIVILEPDFTQCVRLRTLEIVGKKSMAMNSINLSTLRLLEVLKLNFCSALTTIQGLSGLHSLTTLVLFGCEAVRGVPELGCLKALTHLDLRESGVKEIAGVQELHLLTSLHLGYCSSLRRLPWLGHLKALAYLSIRRSGVEEIPGVEDLVSLEGLYCWRSRLKRLPDLHHLRRLRRVDVGGTPLSRDCGDYGRGRIEYNATDMV